MRLEDGGHPRCLTERDGLRVTGHLKEPWGERACAPDFLLGVRMNPTWLRWARGAPG